jgi:hypothetical protein
MNAIGVLAALATILSAGFGTFALIVAEPKRFHLAEQLALSWLFGVGAVSISLWLFGFVLHGFTLFAVVTVFSVVLPGFAWKKNGRFAFLATRRPGAVELVLISCLGLQLLVITYLCFKHTLGWDGILNWEIKARYAFANGGTVPSAYFRDAGRAFSHPDYPLAIPLTELWLYLWLGDANQFWTKIIFPIFYASGLLLLITISFRLTGKIWTGLVAGLVLFFIPQISVQGGSAIVGYVDLPLSFFYLAAVGYLVCADKVENSGCFRIHAACLALLPWVKREGSLLWLIAAVCSGLIIWRSRRSARHFWALLPGVMLALGWRIYLKQMHAVPSSDFIPLTLANLRANIDRFVPVLQAFGSEFTEVSRWGCFWLLATVATFYLIRKFRDRRAIVFVTATIAPLSVYAISFLFSDWLDYRGHIVNSISRLLMHVTPLACLALPVALGSLPSLRNISDRGEDCGRLEIQPCQEQCSERTAGVDFV